MKKLLIIAGLFAITFSPLYAQRGSENRGERGATPEQRAERMTDRMAVELELTDAQKEQVYKIHLENAQKRQVEAEARRSEMQERREAMRAKSESQKSEIEAVLTPEQKQKWEEKRAESSERRDKMRDKKGRPGGREMHKKSDDEKAKVRNYRQSRS